MDAEAALADLEPVPLKRGGLQQGVLPEHRRHARRDPERGLQTGLGNVIQIPEPGAALRGARISIDRALP